ncbi:hypothetical protein GRI44_09305 [Altererythrobacter confluentis]|uniref:Uncharacterized protein n=1 Tax=Allopontixanthobacter confluentis TaxID=1849021 RepID=A0A6L7GJW6_9SPHN|nr:hypothetical protein [Allopontixanthobacter confluentis]MXP14941.1 hypothetical protein [Allopontixanthobacter confluentis]
MATRYQSLSPADHSQSPATVGAFVDRWIYVFMAVFLIAIVLVGFIPDSIQKISAVSAGQRPAFPLAMHLHAVLMGAWMLLLLAQTTLMATGRKTHHMKLGVAGMVLAPALVIAGLVLVPTNIQSFTQFAAGSPPEAQAQINGFLQFMTNIALAQIRAGACFLLLVVLALAARKRDSGLHKRLIILATTVPLPAAFDRMPFLYHTLPESPLTMNLWPLLAIAPMFLWDVYRSHSIHRAYWVYAIVMVPTAIAVQLLWGTDWWMRTGGALIGIPT